jgi:RNA polymerase sigma-70 factor (ECF subfamily)
MDQPVCDLQSWDEEQLIAAAKAGQRIPFGELCKRHGKATFHVTYRITRNREDAEDAVQDSFLSAFIHLKDFDQRSQFRTWLTRIAINAALGKLRKKRGILEVPIKETDPSCELGVSQEIQDHAPDPEETYRVCEQREIVNAAISKLQPRAQKVVQLHRLQERSLRETAEVLDISTAAVKSQIFRATRALRQMPVLRSVASSIRRALVE